MPRRFADRRMLGLIRLGYSVGTAAKMVGRTLQWVAQRKRRDQKFAKAVGEAERAGCQALVDGFLEASCDTPKNWRAAAWILDRMRTKQ